MMVSQEDKEKIDKLVEKHETDPGPLISILQEVQETFGYLPKDILIYLSRKLRISESKIWGIVTFYTQFYLEPRGKNTVRVCLGTACHVKGARKILDRLKKILGIQPGETTKDLNFSLETVRCLGTCFLAPVVMVNQDYFGKLTPDRIEKIINQYRKD
ncbi:NADH-quinone oxidoreductase subunit NuoE [Candidatus Aerophobetes bacterium]|uniref:NADH-quinone oxidoreductase subunit NuoE n=1 Tax=Aerophobetes bacterium TaxID=2030807 RepID=A0A662DMF3_UNCAE|nr:MAG: NADH-quinone oxidoreductase subunit NuoE [Candidatus Aerophobetes bacterium]